MKPSRTVGASPQPLVPITVAHSAGGSSLADNLKGDSADCVPPKSARRDFQNWIFEAFGGYKKFWKKVGIYLRAITGDSCQFSLERFTHDFIVLCIRKPCHYRKGVKLEELANFFSISSYERSEDLSERSEYGGGHSPPAPDSIGGVVLSENTVRAKRERIGVTRGGGGYDY